MTSEKVRSIVEGGHLKLSLVSQIDSISVARSMEDKELEWDECPACGHYIYEEYDQCPNCLWMDEEVD